MRTFLLVAVTAAVFAACSSTSKYNTPASEEKVAAVRENLAERDFTIDVKTAIPSRGRTVNVTSRYDLRISGDSVYSHLPYFGRAYSLPYGGGEGLIFEGEMRDYVMKPGKKGGNEITFSIRTREDNYDFMLSVWDNGSSYFTVQPNNKQSISFTGDMRF